MGRVRAPGDESTPQSILIPHADPASPKKHGFDAAPCPWIPAFAGMTWFFLVSKGPGGYTTIYDALPDADYHCMDAGSGRRFERLFLRSLIPAIFRQIQLCAKRRFGGRLAP